MIKNIFATCCLLASAAMMQAQSVLDVQQLAYAKAHLADLIYHQAYTALLSRADADLQLKPLSVMDKDYTPASGSKHDYVSLARYAWPDLSKPNGLPYIMRDGISNPELEKFDRNRLSTMANTVYRLSLAYYFSGNEKYAQQATRLLRTWFLDKSTKMNPNLRYAQHVPGVSDGRCYGVLDAYSFVDMLDGVQLLERSKAFSAKDSKQLKAWFAQLLKWMTTHPQALEEGNQANNHAIAYDAQVAAYALYTGNQKIFQQVMEAFPARRIAQQIAPDGSQPHELTRTLAFGYSEYNLTHIIDLLLMAKHAGLDVQQYAVKGEHSFFKAMDFMTSYMGKPVSAWPYQQISGWEGKQQEMARDYYRAYTLTTNSPIVEIQQEGKNYLRLYRQHIVRNWSDLFVLLYETPTKIDNAMARADEQLRYALKCTTEARQKLKGGKCQGEDDRVSPRSIDKDGNLVLVGPKDWCSGFFAGTLWQMYQYSHEQYWRENAVSNTWPIESAKWHRGTHDLGFMIGDSFGKAYQLTGEQSYRDVMLQAARTLITRYSPKVGCIRSWDHNADKWKYPVIIDNMMNLEMLFEAYKLTGDKRFYDIAVSHANTTMKNHFRDDYSSYHVVDYNPETGAVRMKVTAQGYSDGSYWSRGQGWALYGYTMCYRYTHDKRYLDQAKGVANFLFSLKNMPEDGIFYWDMKDPAIPNAPRDASAAALVASAFYELQGYVDADLSKQYKAYADKIVYSLIDHYQAPVGSNQGFLLLHSTGHKPANSEVDVPINYADYFYMEALRRKAQLDDK